MKVTGKIDHKIKSVILKKFELIIAYNYMKNLEKCLVLLKRPQKIAKKSKLEIKIKPTKTAVTRGPGRQLKTKFVTESKHDH